MNPRSTSSIQRVLRHIDEHLGQPLTLSDLAEVAGLSMWRFATVFRQQVGIAPIATFAGCVCNAPRR